VTGSVLFYVQHLLGIGHLRRALYLVDAMTREGLVVTLVTGGLPLPELVEAKAERVVQLAPIRARDASFKDLIDADGRPIDDALRAQRRQVLLDTFAAARPDAVIIEAFPFGRRAFRYELEPLVEAARTRQPRALALCSLRDIVIVPGDAKRQSDAVARVRAGFDAVLVHGDPQLIPLEASFPAAEQIADRLVYTGYVGAPDGLAGPEDGVGAGEVLVSAGGGAMGGPLMAAALAARRLGCLADLGWRLLAGPNLPSAQFAELMADLPDGVVVERYRADFPQMLQRCRMSVSQAGYNTVLEILAARAAAVLVPFADLRETEQTLRTARLAACGAVEMLPSSMLSPERLAQAIERAVLRPPTALAVEMGGAHRTAQLVARMIENPDGGRGQHFRIS
jgi:predicted glycosyltransferase